MENQNTEHNKEAVVKEIKAICKEMDGICQRIKELNIGGDLYAESPEGLQRAKETAIMKSQETSAWLGIGLMAIEPAADGMRM